MRALFELAKRRGSGTTTVSQIAQAQAIPPRFLESILGQLRRSGFVESRRGARGGYLLAAAPAALCVGDVIRFVDGPVAPVRCVQDEKDPICPLRGRCALMGMWRRARDAVAGVYDQTTFQDLIDDEAAASRYVDNYCI